MKQQIAHPGDPQPRQALGLTGTDAAQVGDRSGLAGIADGIGVHG